MTGWPPLSGWASDDVPSWDQQTRQSSPAPGTSLEIHIKITVIKGPPHTLESTSPFLDITSRYGIQAYIQLENDRKNWII